MHGWTTLITNEDETARIHGLPHRIDYILIRHYYSAAIIFLSVIIFSLYWIDDRSRASYLLS